MEAVNEFSFDDRDDQQGYGNIDNSSEALYDNDDEVNVDGEDDDELEEEDELDDDETDEFLNDDDLDPAYDNTLGDDIAFDADETNTDVNEDKDFEAHLAPESVDPNPNETPEEGESKQEGSGYTPQPEYSDPQQGNDASYSERNDVTPPNEHEFPSRGPAKADFESRAQGRTTGRMIGHEPGTEGGI